MWQVAVLVAEPDKFKATSRAPFIQMPGLDINHFSLVFLGCIKNYNPFIATGLQGWIR